MRQRTTFVHKPGDAIDPALLRVPSSSGDVLTGPAIQAARQERLTIAFDELPSELQAVLEHADELFLRWSGPRPYDAVSPLLSRVSPGFHLFYTPRADPDADSPALCAGLRTAFGGLDCSSPKASFTPLPRDQFPQSAAFQFFQALESLSRFSRYAAEVLCPAADEDCAAQASRLVDAVSLDVSYDAIGRVLKATALWPHASQPLHIPARQHRAEVGILAEDKPPNLEPQELGVSGILTVLGEDSRPSPVLFSFPSRHRSAGASFSAEFPSPTGFHPTLKISLDSNKSPWEDRYCSPYAYITLPSILFPDRYQLADDLFLASKNLSALRYASEPVDLEAPDYVMNLWGSAVLVELSPPATGEPQPWSVEIPLHLRYLEPSRGGYRDVQVPYPAVFWACDAEEGTKFATNPFDQTNLGYDTLFGPRTVFWHADPRPSSADGRLTNKLTVPVLDLDKSRWVNAGTAAAILLGFVWVGWKIWASRSGSKGPAGGSRVSAHVEEKKKN